MANVSVTTTRKATLSQKCRVGRTIDMLTKHHRTNIHKEEEEEEGSA